MKKFFIVAITILLIVFFTFPVAAFGDSQGPGSDGSTTTTTTTVEDTTTTTTLAEDTTTTTLPAGDTTTTTMEEGTTTTLAEDTTTTTIGEDDTTTTTMEEGTTTTLIEDATTTTLAEDTTTTTLPAGDTTTTTMDSNLLENLKPSYLLSANIVSDKVEVKPGDSYKYKIILKNSGQNDLTNVTVTDKLPDIVTYNSSTFGTYNQETKELSYTVPVLKSSEIFEIEINVTLQLVVNEAQSLTNLLRVSNEKVASIEKISIVTISSQLGENPQNAAENYNPFIYTDKDDYNPGEEVTIFGEGFIASCDVEIIIKNDAGEVENSATIKADEAGKFVYKYNILGSTHYTVEAKSVTRDENGQAKFLDSATYGWTKGNHKDGLYLGSYWVGTIKFSLDNGQDGVPAFCLDYNDPFYNSYDNYQEYKLGGLPNNFTAGEQSLVSAITGNYPIEELVFDGNSYSKNEVAASVQFAIWKVKNPSLSTSNAKVNSLGSYIYGNSSPGFSVALNPASAVNYFPADRDHSISATVGNSRITFKNVKVDFSTSAGTLNPTFAYTGTSSPYAAVTNLHYDGDTNVVSTISASVSFSNYGLTTSTNVLYQYDDDYDFSWYYWKWGYWDSDYWRNENGYSNHYQRMIIPIIPGFSGTASKTWCSMGSIVVTKNGMMGSDLVSITLKKGDSTIETKANVGNGTYTFSNLVFGNDYSITETYADGNTYTYAAATQSPANPINVASSTAVNVSLTNNPVKGSITVSKTGLTGSDSAEFVLELLPQMEEVEEFRSEILILKFKNIILDNDSATAGILSSGGWSELPWGTYRLTEIVPAGYNIPSFSIGGVPAVPDPANANAILIIIGRETKDVVVDVVNSKPSVTTTTGGTTTTTAITVLGLASVEEEAPDTGRIEILGIKELPFTGQSIMAIIAGILLTAALSLIIVFALRKKSAK